VLEVVREAYPHDPSESVVHNEVWCLYDSQITSQEDGWFTPPFDQWADERLLSNALPLLEDEPPGSSVPSTQVDWEGLRRFTYFSAFPMPVETVAKPHFEKVIFTVRKHMRHLALQPGCSMPARTPHGPPGQDACLDLIDEAINWCSEREGTLAAAKQHIDDLEPRVQQKLKDGWTPPRTDLAQDAVATPATTGKRRKRTEVPDDYEANIRIKQFLEQHPGAPIREVVEAVGLSAGKVSVMDAWRREMGRREAAKKPAKKADRPLTKEMLACIGKEDNTDDVDARIDAEEAVWRETVEAADPQERARLHAMPEHERKELIEAVANQQADRITERRG
jgi:hypothetical protein